MAETDGEGDGGLSSLPRRASQRIVQDFRHDIQEAKRKGADILPSAFILFVEKWLGFWLAIIGSAFTVGVLGMGLVYIAEVASTVSVLSNSVPWLIGHVWILGLLTVLTWGVMLFSLLLVSGVRLVLWSHNVYRDFWNRHTPPFSPDSSDNDSTPWPPSDHERDTARDRMLDFFGKGGITFIGIFILLIIADRIDSETLNELLSAPTLTAIGESFDLGFGIVDFDGLLGSIAPNATQPQLVLFALVFVLPGAVMSIGARNLLFLTESHIRDHIEIVRNGNLLGRSTAPLIALMLYSIGICANIFAQWG